jgi:fibronectin type 3 domain-containing protein
MPVPAAPAGLSVSSFSASAVGLAWTAVAGADSYNVYRATATTGGWGAFAKVNAAAVMTNAYTDNAANSTPDPTAGASYLYYVTAVDGADEGPGGNVVAASFIAAVTRVPGDFEDDIQTLLESDELAEEATYTRYGHAPATIKGWFDDESADNKGTRGEVQNSEPQFTCATADVEYAGTRDTLVVSGITYYVTAVQPDGTGLTVLKLSRHAE